MNPFVCPDKIFISPHPQDMRSGIRKLAGIVNTEFGHDATDGSLYVFVSRDARKCKLLRFDLNGWVMCYCTLAQGCFKWTGAQGDQMLLMEQRRLFWLLDGLDPGLKNAPEPITARTFL